MVVKLPQVPHLKSYQALCSGDAEQDFFNNISHLQASFNFSHYFVNQSPFIPDFGRIVILFLFFHRGGITCQCLYVILWAWIEKVDPIAVFICHWPFLFSGSPSYLPLSRAHSRPHVFILLLQKHRRARALSRFKNVVSSGCLSEVIPLFCYSHCPKLRVNFYFRYIINLQKLKIGYKFCFKPSIPMKLLHS